MKSWAAQLGRPSDSKSRWCAVPNPSPHLTASLMKSKSIRTTSFILFVIGLLCFLGFILVPYPLLSPTKQSIEPKYIVSLWFRPKVRFGLATMIYRLDGNCLFGEESA
jgi:hypothetical protein